MGERIAAERGLFITFEGSDGVGKSSQIAGLADRIRTFGHEVVQTREPGGTQLGELVRDILLQSPAEAHDALSDALLFNAARRRLTREVIRPALARAAVVLCDRYSDSTLAYQGHGGGVPLDVLQTLAEVATGGLTPDRTILIDLPVVAGLARRHTGEARELTRFETADEHGLDFHERVRLGYRDLAAGEPHRWRIIDGSMEVDGVAAAVWAAVEDLFGGEGA